MVNEQDGRLMPLWTRDFISITMINFLIFFSFQMLQPTLPIYVKQLGGGDTIIGLTAGMFTISALLTRPYAGLKLDKIGRKTVFLVGIGICIISILSYSLFPIIGLVIVFRLLHGFGWGASSTASNTIASDCIPRERFGEGMGYFSLSSSLAMAIAPATGLTLISKCNIHILFFTSTGLILLVFLLVCFRQYKKVDPSQTVKVEKRALYEKSSIRPAIVIFFVAITYGALTSFIALYAAERGIRNIGLFFMIYAISLILSRPGLGKLNDRFGSNCIMIPGLILIVIAMVLLSQATTQFLFFLVAFIYGVGFGAAQTTMQTMAVANVDPWRRGAANATFFTGFDSGIGLGAMCLGAVASHWGYSMMYLWSAGSIAIAFILYFLMTKKNNIQC